MSTIWFYFLSAFYTWFTLCLGDATNLAIINLTPYDLVQSKEPHSYQMVAWDDAFPSSVPGPSTNWARVQIEVGTIVEEADDAGEFYYTLDDGSDNTIVLALDVSGDAVGGYEITIVANFDGISTANNPSSAPIGFRDNGAQDPETWTPFILAGNKDVGYIGNNPPTSWLASLLPLIGCRTLQEITIPGSHNAGMSKIQHNTEFSNPANTQTQTLDILGQLIAGSRYLDVRPVLISSQFYTGHYSNTGSFADWQGSAGQSIDEVIADINEFTAVYSELVILYLSHSVNTDAGYVPFEDDEWNSVLYRFYTGINNLWAVDTSIALTKIPLSDFISDGPAVVIVVDERDKSFLDERFYTGRGFFPKEAFPKSGSYADTDNLDTLRENQYDKLQEYINSDYGDALFELSWTITLQGGSNANLLDHITTRANIVNNHLAEVQGSAPYNSPFLWANSGGQPNIILIDNFTNDKHLLALAAGFNLYYHTCA